MRLGEAARIALTLPSPRGRGKRTRQRMAPPQGACGRGCAPVPNPSWRRGLSERSEFRSLSPHFSPASCYGRRSTRCAGAYSRKPLRHSVQLCLQRLAVRAPQHNGVSTPSRRSLVRNAGSPSGLGQRHPKGHARAPMVLGPFAETKGSRRAGPKPRKNPPSACGAETPQNSLSLTGDPAGAGPRVNTNTVVPLIALTDVLQ